MNRKLFMTPQEAANAFNNEISAECIRARIKAGICPFGVCVVKPGNAKGKYLISRREVEEIVKTGKIKMLMFNNQQANISNDEKSPKSSYLF